MDTQGRLGGFRWTRTIADTVKSYRVTLDRSGRWHIAFAVIPDPIPGPGDGSVVGVDRGVAVSVALSSGELLRFLAFVPAKPNGCADCSGVWPGRERGSHRRARTGWPLRGCAPVKQIAAVTGWKRPPPMWRAASTPSASRT